MAVRIRMKKFGRRHRPYFRVCAIDGRTQRDGRVLEELGTYDPLVPDVDARAVLNAERIDYWLGVGAQPSEKVKVLIKKYGTEGTHREKQQAALQRLAQQRRAPEPPAVPEAAEEPAAEPAGAAEAVETAQPAAEGESQE